MGLYWFIVLPLIIGLLFYFSHSYLTRVAVLVAQLAFFILALRNFWEVKQGGMKLEIVGGYDLGVGIALKADLFSSTMVVLTVFLFSCMLLYNLNKSYVNHLFLFLFVALEGLICGIFLSNDLFNIYVMIEVSTIIVSILIIFKKDSQSIYDGIIYLFANLTSMTLFLLGIGYIYKIFGTTDLALLAQMIPLTTDGRTLIVPFALLVTAVCLKSAIMPLFSWLPKAHGTASAPSIVSAILSGLYVKGGVYLFVRIFDLFMPVFDEATIFMVFGFLTAVIGWVFALSQRDIKLMLAYSTVSQIGVIVFGLSLNSTYGYWGAIYHILNHAIFKSTLFLTAGIIVDEYHTRDITKISGVMARMPYVSIASIFAILGITGAPLFNGSFSKNLIEKGMSDSLVFELAFFIINIGTILIFIKYGQIFKGSSAKKSHIRWNQKFVIMLLALTCFLMGIFGPFLIEFLFGFETTVSWSAYLTKFLIYGLTLACGYLFYRVVYLKVRLFGYIQAMELSFNEIIMAIFVFFTGFLILLILQT
ncbi:MAG: proton-conducting transporter membrane subunit [Erysipelotrichaceae bacterium]|nr:proton-conducting transporter membrane subunit [Erysipelotrichaceae bacterium]MDD3810082.1 proton-conducting transporter membrane subunit [Erysipelotrichaceae bacterium]